MRTFTQKMAFLLMTLLCCAAMPQAVMAQDCVDIGEGTTAVNGNVPVACMFRLHDGLMFWHGCPKKFGQRQYDKFICPSNAMLGACDELTVYSITAAVSTYLNSGDFGEIKDINFAEFSEPKTVNEKPSKLAKFGFGPEAGNAPEPTPTPEQ